MAAARQLGISWVMECMIVIGSYKGSPFLRGCLDSIPTDIPCLVVRNGGYECGSLRWCQSHLNVDEFLFLQDSTEIKDRAWLYDIFKKKGMSISLNYEPGWFGSFLGKYRMEILRQVKIPETPTKMDAVLAEMSVGQRYEKLEPNREILWPELRIENARRDIIHGREVAVYENEHFIKYKSCFSGDHITPCCERDKSLRSLYQ